MTSILLFLFSILAAAIWRLTSTLWTARRLRSHYERQGVLGPEFRYLVGNLVEVRRAAKSVLKLQTSFDSQPSMYRVIPDICNFHQVYGEFFCDISPVFDTRTGDVFLYEIGCLTRLVVADAELALQVLSSRARNYKKAELPRRAFKPLLGNGLVMSDGELWRRQRRILSPGFCRSSVERLTKHMNDAGQQMVQRWRHQLKSASLTIDVQQEMWAVTLDVIARALFGTELATSKAPTVFHCLNSLFNSAVAYMNSFRRLLPGHNLLHDFLMSGKESLVKQLMLEMVVQRRGRQQGSDDTDLLSFMLDTGAMGLEQLLDECKSLVFAGHSTTATVLTWSLVLLAGHQDWQSRARQEARSTAAGRTTWDQLAKLEVLTMIIYETLRLYPPAVTLTRECHQTHQLGSITVLPGTQVVVPVALLLQRKDIWGDDAFSFNPERFRNKSDMRLPGFLAFGAGPRMCMGKNFALAEVKLLLCLMLSSFSFHLSDDYRHAPGSMLSMKALHGAPLVVKELRDHLKV